MFRFSHMTSPLPSRRQFTDKLSHFLGKNHVHISHVDCHGDAGPGPGPGGQQDGHGPDGDLGDDDMAGPVSAGPVEGKPQAVPFGGQKLCPVSGKPLGVNGEPIGIEIDDRKIFVCCKQCVKAVQKDPLHYLKKVDEELAAQQADGDQVAKEEVLAEEDNGIAE
jgi:hypothetical protein